MGYIRTKNKRTNEENIYPSDVDKNFLDFVDDEIIAEADTIVELCDEVVVEMRFTETGYIAHLNKNISELTSFVEYLKECIETTKQDEILNVYASIWTSKGLIYVAKMNEDGELELI